MTNNSNNIYINVFSNNRVSAEGTAAVISTIPPVPKHIEQIYLKTLQQCGGRLYFYYRKRKNELYTTYVTNSTAGRSLTFDRKIINRTMQREGRGK